LRAVGGQTRFFASAQAAWRFWLNPRVSLKTLAQPLLQHARSAVPLECLDYTLIVLDWSQLHYNTHTSKLDRIELTHRNDLGYELLTALLLSATDGQPITPLCHDLRSAAGMHSTRRQQVGSSPRKLDRLGSVMRFVHEQQLSKPPVFLIDREADSVAHSRRWDRQGRCFLIRADDNLRRGAFHDTREVLFHGVKARQWVGETEIVLDRPSKQNQGRVYRRGKALRLRLVVA
jgi:hypothetical protein